jgi:competence protein ComEA
MDGEQIMVAVIGAVPAPPTAGTAPGIVNVNTATAAELENLPRVGPTMAQRIIDWRTANGRFRAAEDLLSVPGIGEKTLDGFRDLLTF